MMGLSSFWGHRVCTPLLLFMQANGVRTYCFSDPPMGGFAHSQEIGLFSGASLVLHHASKGDVNLPLFEIHSLDFDVFWTLYFYFMF